mmetsp:Transcript_13236/g.17117  ORF Transcript_13236/g.17117 Transcript_13236/m.17117 type:complete len:463 (+) Transcript_13236:105-1493(+)
MSTSKKITKNEALELLKRKESFFFDFKGKELKPAKLTKSISAFANSNGGEILLGADETPGADGSEHTWNGFNDFEAANPIFQVLHEIDQSNDFVKFEFLEADDFPGYLLLIEVSKYKSVVAASDAHFYVRKNAQNLRLNESAIEKLRLDKGIVSFEDEIVNTNKEEVINSETIIGFLLNTVPTAEPIDWLRKQYLLVDERPNVAGVLLYADNPQSLLPKRSAIKILRYQTKSEAERDFLVSDPETIEGPLYSLIYDAVDRVKTVIEGIEKLGPAGLERIQYPQEALHEIVTNAVLHRDYSVAADVQIRIFDNRIEIESPGRLPGHVTIDNIADVQFARNPKSVRLINKFKNPPNKDVGEGINTAFEAMEKLRLKKPEFEETENSLVVTLRHESLASPEQMVLEYLERNTLITNSIARELTGIKSENTMKNVFYRLRDRKQIEQSPKIPGYKHSWRKYTEDNN